MTNTVFYKYFFIIDLVCVFFETVPIFLSSILDLVVWQLSVSKAILQNDLNNLKINAEDVMNSAYDNS